MRKLFLFTFLFVFFFLSAENLSKTYCGLTLGTSKADKAESVLNSNGYQSKWIDGKLVAISPSVYGQKWSMAVFEFSKGSLITVTYVSTPLTKSDADLFSKKVLSALKDKHNDLPGKRLEDGIGLSDGMTTAHLYVKKLPDDADVMCVYLSIWPTGV